MAVRHVESIIRMSEAHAMMHLRESARCPRPRDARPRPIVPCATSHAPRCAAPRAGQTALAWRARSLIPSPPPSHPLSSIAQVNDEDVNVAIGVMLRSFIATQKQALQKQLAKKFSKYTNYQRDFNHLLLDALRALLRDQIAHDAAMQQMRGAASQHSGAGASEEVEVEVAQLEGKARDLGVLDLQPFLDSALFAANGFSVDAARGKISHPR